MKNIRSEYKLLIILASIFLVVLTIVFIKEDVFNTKINELKSKDYVKCTTEEITGNVDYTNHNCTITDDLNGYFNVSYPEINIDSKDVRNINKKLSSQYDQLINKINFDTIDGKFYLTSINSLDYKLYSYNGILSVLIITNKVTEDESGVDYEVYNIDTSTGNLIKDNEMKDRCNITFDLSSKIRMAVIKMYAMEHHYDYIGKISYLHDDTIDESIENVTYNNISRLYLDNEGNRNFIFWLYNPDYKRKIPYYFKVDNNENITYEIKEK